MPYFTKADPRDDAVKLVTKVMKRWHPMLAADEVTIGVLFAFPGEKDDPDEPVLKHHGYAAVAVVKITSYKLRVQGLPDATITIDENEWKRLSGEERTAVIDHELCHLQPKTDKGGLTKRDDCGRPMLRLRLHNWQIGGFSEVVERHGDSAIEKQQVGRLKNLYGEQLSLFPDAA